MGDIANAISPVRLFNMQQARKLGGDLSRSAMPGAGTLRSGMTRWQAAKGFAAGSSWGDVAGAYWRGQHLEDFSRPGYSRISSSAIYERMASRNATIRRTAVGVLGAATVGSMFFGKDNVVSGVGRAGTTMGLAAGASAYMMERSFRGPAGGAFRMGSYGLAGLTVMNMLRSGDQMGPF